MFIGHFAIAFAAKRAAPEVSLGTLFLSCQLADLVWPNLVLAGVERFAIAPGITEATPLDFQFYPYSHSLAALAGWSACLAVVYKLGRRSASLRSLATIAALVLSHWLLDVISHRPDVPLTLGDDTKLGLGLWYSIPATIAVELSMLAAGVLIYTKTTAPVRRVGTWALGGLIAFLLIVNVGNLFGPPPPSVAAVAWSAQAMWLLVAWGYWVDRNRRV